MIAIINAQLILEYDRIDDGVLLIDDRRIVAVGDRRTLAVPPDAQIYDANGYTVGPGFVDIHCHGGGGCRFDRDPVGAAAYFLDSGTTTVLATLYTDIDADGYIDAIDRVKEAMTTCENLGGLYMEGPYTNEKYGACPEKNRWRGTVCRKEYERVVRYADRLAKLWAVAPERDGVAEFVKTVHTLTPHAVFSVAHSEATPEQIAALKPYGLSVLTHCTNATGRIPTAAGTRSCGPDEACFLDDDMYAEVICDSAGIHVHPDMLRLIKKIKGSEKIILISDSFVSDNPSPPELAHITDLNFDENGDLCGSNLTLNVACRNMRKHTDATVNEVFRMASRNPARALKMDGEIGSIAVGKRADLVVLDDDFNVKNVFLNGKLVR